MSLIVLDEMAIWKDVIEIKDRLWNRAVKVTVIAVKVTVIAPEDRKVVNVQDLAQRAWRTRGQEDHRRRGTVKVEAFGR